MQEKRVAPYGSWKSPITADYIVSKSISLGAPLLDGDDIYWGELRPSEGGRVVVVGRSEDGATEDLVPAPFNARTRVHEYGGGAYTVHAGTLYFANFADQRLYRTRRGEDPQPLTPAAVDLRYADFIVDAGRNRLIAIREDHRQSSREAVNAVVSIPLDGEHEGEILVSGNDFYSTPRLSPDGSQLAWLTWNHPNMPWDGSELWVAPVHADGSLGEAKLIAGGVSESIFQPAWSPDGVLYFVSDRTDWWNLYRWRGSEIDAVTQMEAEFGQPQWSFGGSTYDFVSDRQILCTYSQNGISSLALIDTSTLILTQLETPYTDVSGIQANERVAVLRAGSPTQMPVILRVDLNTLRSEVIRQSGQIDIDPRYFSQPQPIEFPTENGLTAHAFYYPPHNPDFTAPAGERPLLMVKSHGGPTGASSSTLDLSIQYWTSRGFALLDVNYGGSTGYGRAYRERLKGRWGIVDIDDCCNGARYLADQGWVDGERMMIRGGSAGGYTTLGALAFRKVFSAGASYYGVSDLAALAEETHKFESRYLDGLIGPYPERADLYRKRSPIHHVQGLDCPVIFFQGLEDKVVLPNQAEMMVQALLHKEVPVAYLPFEGEQHGFRKAENIKRALEGELYFYSRIFNFTPADEIEPVEIENL
ncbi:MAG: S9 family peptidase [Caldilineaceae bacterium]|nr:S9 family peptidase [Caldilineaceae bacterium]